MPVEKITSIQGLFKSYQLKCWENIAFIGNFSTDVVKKVPEKPGG